MSENLDELPPLSSDAATLMLHVVAETATACRPRRQGTRPVTAEPIETVGEDPRVGLIAQVIDDMWDDLDGMPSPTEEAAAVVEALDRHDEQQGVVRVNLLKQRAIEAHRDRLAGALHAALTAFENGITPPSSMIEGWRLAEAGR